LSEKGQRNFNALFEFYELHNGTELHHCLSVYFTHIVSSAIAVIGPTVTWSEYITPTSVDSVNHGSWWDCWMRTARVASTTKIAVKTAVNGDQQ